MSEEAKYQEKINHLKNADGYIFAQTEEFYSVKDFIEQVKRDTENEDIYGTVFKLADFSGLKLFDIDFSGYDLSGANFKNSLVSECKFNNTAMDSCNFENAGIFSSNFDEASIYSSNFKNAQIYNSSFKEAEAGGCDFTDADLNNVNFNLTNLVYSKAVNAIFRVCNFEQAKMRYVDFPNNEFLGCNFFIANLTDADLRLSNCMMSSFYKTNLTRTDFAQANLAGCNLDCMFLDGAILKNTEMTDAELPPVEDLIKSYDFYDAKNLLKAKNITEDYLKQINQNKKIDYKDRAGDRYDPDLENEEFTYLDIAKIYYEKNIASQRGGFFANIEPCLRKRFIENNQKNEADKKQFFFLHNDTNFDAETNYKMLPLSSRNLENTLIMLWEGNCYEEIKNLPPYYITQENLLKGLDDLLAAINDESIDAKYKTFFTLDKVFFSKKIAGFLEYLQIFAINVGTEEMATKVEDVFFPYSHLITKEFYLEVLKRVPYLFEYMPHSQYTYVIEKIIGDKSILDEYKYEFINSYDRFLESIAKNPDTEQSIIFNYVNEFFIKNNQLEDLKKAIDERYIANSLSFVEDLENNRMSVYNLFRSFYEFDLLSKELLSGLFKLKNELILNIANPIDKFDKNPSILFSTIFSDFFDSDIAKYIYEKFGQILINELSQKDLELIAQKEPDKFFCESYFAYEKIISKDSIIKILNQNKSIYFNLEHTRKLILQINGEDVLNSKEFCEAMINSDAFNLNQLPEENKTKELCDLAIQKNFDAIIYVPDKFLTEEQKQMQEDVCIKLLQKDESFDLYNIPTKLWTEKVCIGAFSAYKGMCCTYETDISDNIKTQKFWEEAVKSDGWYIMRLQDKIIVANRKKDGIGYESKVTPQMYEDAVYSRPDYLHNIPYSDLTRNMCKIAINSPNLNERYQIAEYGEVILEALSWKREPKIDISELKLERFNFIEEDLAQSIYEDSIQEDQTEESSTKTTQTKD